MNDVDFPVAEVLAGIEAAHAVGLSHIKVNMVVKRGTNDHEILPMAQHFAAAAPRCASLNTWMLAPPTAGAWTRCCHRPRSLHGCKRHCHWFRWPQRARRNGRTLGLCQRAGPARPWPGRGGRHQQRDQGLLRRLQPRTPVHRRQTHLFLPPRATTCAACCAPAPATKPLPRPSPHLATPHRPVL